MEKNITELFEKGMEMMQSGEYQVAEQLFKKARDLSEKNGKIR
jgi:thioredoxin-like negative regulator of GroEL